MNRLFVSLLFAYLTLTSVQSALAHKPSDSYLKIRSERAENSTMSIQWDIALKDLDFSIGLDSDQNGEITWGEVKNRRAAIEAHALSKLQVSVHGRNCRLSVTDLLIAQHSDGAYAALVIDTDAASDTDLLKVEYSLFFDIDPTHRGLVLFSNEVATSTYILGPANSTVEIRTAETSTLRTLVQYIREGVWHIWIGFDHILFLISLLLPAVFLRKDEQWEPVESFWPAYKTVLKIVTLFTIAHSITLWLAVMEYVMLPSGFVEATIAFSIIVTAVNNLYPVIKLPAWMIAFAFGLIHGFGFANVLLDLGLSSVALAVSLFGFNVGVELGQIAIVIAFLPIVFLIRKSSFYKLVIFVGGSVLIALIAVIWFAERVGNFEVLGF